MNAKNLSLKLCLVMLLVAASVGIYLYKGIDLDIDLSGGTSMIFALRTSQMELDELRAQKKAKEEALAAAANDEERKKLGDAIAKLDEQLKSFKSGQDVGNLSEKVISILEKRINPKGLLSLKWIPMGRDRFEVRMPASRKETQDAKYAYQEALAALEKTNVQPADMRSVLKAEAGGARDKAIAALAGQDADMKGKLSKLAAVNDRMSRDLAAIAKADADIRSGTLSPAQAREAEDSRLKAQGDLDDARIEYSDLQEGLMRDNISMAGVQAILRLYVSPAEAESLRSESEVKQRKQKFEEGLAELKAKAKTRHHEKEFMAVVDKYQEWARMRKGLDDPADLKRLIGATGVLEFRMGPQDPRRPGVVALAPEKGGPPPMAELDRYIKELQDGGPEAARRRNAPYEWFPIRGDAESFGSLIVAHWAGQSYVLLCNTKDNELIQQSGEEAWRLKESYPTSDEWGRGAVGFTFDDRGAKKFYEMTLNHINQAMAILLDDEVYSAPNIKSAISSSGVITGKYTQDEIARLVDTLNAGSLPARLTVVDTPAGKMAKPVAENTFGPALGEENLRLAVKAGWICLIAITVFMLVYYMAAGTVAVFAMVANVLFIMAAMSLLNATFSLAGIAGVILSIGMAVDANVLIYERLREEQDKGQSVRMALKNAYERAFSAIFDSNITTLLTCFILGTVARGDIRGFAITLGLGVLFNLFTAVTVTRWMFQFMVEKGLIKRPFRMLRLIHVPKIKWMQKRYYFWGVSLATAVLGIACLVWQGNNIWGIDFTSGTQAIVQFRDDALLTATGGGKPELPNDGLVRSLLRSTAHGLNFPKLEDARVEQRIDPDRVSNFLKEHFPEGNFPDVYKNKTVTRQDWIKAGLSPEALAVMTGGADSISMSDLGARLPANAYQVATAELEIDKIRKAVRDAFGSALVARTSLRFDGPPSGRFAPMGIDLKPVMGEKTAEKPLMSMARITPQVCRTASPSFQNELQDYEGGAVFVIQDIVPAVSDTDLLQRIRSTRSAAGFADQALDITSVLHLGGKSGDETFSSFAILVKPAEPLGADEKAWSKFADGESKLLIASLLTEESMPAQQFDAQVAGETATRAIIAIVLGWLAIIGYLWIRFGQIKWGVAAVICLVHDVIIIVGLVALSGWLYASLPGVASALGVSPFKMDMTMVAVLLTIIGYSVNDTIVVFDRIRENRGKLMMVSEKVIDGSINQTLSRTLLTSGTVFTVVFIMYAWGGAGIHAFNYAFLAGVLFGTYSSIAVAAPLLLGFKQAVLHQVAQDATA